LLFLPGRFNLKERLQAPGMTDTKKINPFEPAQPSIPGVPAGTVNEGVGKPADTSAAESSVSLKRTRGLWIAAGAVVVLLVGGGLWLWSSGSTPRSKSFAPVPAARRVPVAESRKVSVELPLAPGIVGTVAELAKPWSSKEFLFRGPFSADPIPAMVVHLPNRQYWAFSLIEPFGTCKLEYVTNLDTLRTEYGYTGTHPMVGDPCTHTVYDLMQYDGGAPDGGLVRGAIVKGAGVRPPIAIEIEVEGKQVRAVRME
jgi:hypothetical protein